MGGVGPVSAKSVSLGPHLVRYQGTTFGELTKCSGFTLTDGALYTQRSHAVHHSLFTRNVHIVFTPSGVGCPGSMAEERRTPYLSGTRPLKVLQYTNMWYLTPRSAARTGRGGLNNSPVHKAGQWRGGRKYTYICSTARARRYPGTD